MHLIGLDIGTTGCKAAIFDVNGNLLSIASREYTVNVSRTNWAEQDAEKVWQLAQETLRETIANVKKQDIVALGLSVQGEAVIPVDARGNAMRPAILGMDTRTGEQNEWLRDKFGAKRIFELTGMPIHTINTLPKLLWLKEYEPELWKNVDRFLLYEDFLIQKMTGSAVISQCLASRTQLYQLRQKKWAEEILESLELESGKLANIQPSGTAVEEMLPELAESLGLSKPPLVVTGGHDQACGALGVGIIRPGLAMVSTGTAEVVEVAMDSPALNKTLYQGNISCYIHVLPELYLAMTLNHSGGLLLRWFRDEFFKKEVRQAEMEGKDAYDLILQNISPEPSSLLLLPHFAGSGTPWFDTKSKGAILGLTFSTTKNELVKAVIEGLTFELRVNLDLLKDGGVEIDELLAIGGGTRSELWLQLKADITGIPVVVPRITEAACWGAALLAGAGAECFYNVSKKAEESIELEKRFYPDSERMKLYESRYSLYREVYPTVKSLSHRI